MPASSHPASHPNQDSYAYGDSESDQRAVLDLAGHPVQRVVAELGAELGGFVAKTRGLVAGQAPDSPVSGKIAYAVLSFGGLLGFAQKYFPVPWASLKYNLQ
jgi:hypothetical protein